MKKLAAELAQLKRKAKVEEVLPRMTVRDDTGMTRVRMVSNKDTVLPLKWQFFDFVFGVLSVADPISAAGGGFFRSTSEELALVDI